MAKENHSQAESLMFTVCVLFYGDYLDLAKRVLNSLENHWRVKDIRLGLNAVSSETYKFAHMWAEKISVKTPVSVYQESSNKNVGKYPLMKRMFHNIESPHIMWFDDDSWLENSSEIWWYAVHKYAELHAVVGSVHRIKQRNKQYLAIEHQPWYAKKPVQPDHVYRFATGGWWVLNSAVARNWDYPFSALHHNGGDSILGELTRQQDLSIGQVTPDLAKCHCEACSRVKPKQRDFDIQSLVHINVGGRAGRRGIGIQNEKYVFADGKANPDLLHQNFSTSITKYGRKNE
jgi:hypothetical protein